MSDSVLIWRLIIFQISSLNHRIRKNKKKRQRGIICTYIHNRPIFEMSEPKIFWGLRKLFEEKKTYFRHKTLIRQVWEIPFRGISFSRCWNLNWGWCKFASFDSTFIALHLRKTNITGLTEITRPIPFATLYAFAIIIANTSVRASVVIFNFPPPTISSALS